jgi:hypothetical protein
LLLSFMEALRLANSSLQRSSRDGQKLLCSSLFFRIQELIVELIVRVQGYGMTETNAYVCSVAGGDYLERV